MKFQFHFLGRQSAESCQGGARQSSLLLTAEVLWVWTQECCCTTRPSSHQSLALTAPATRASNEGYPKVPEDFTITEKTLTGTFSWLKAPTNNFTFKTLVKH